MIPMARSTANSSLTTAAALKCTSLLLYACLAGGIPACATRRAAQGPERVVAAIIDADNARDLDAALACYSDDVIWIPPAGGLIIGKESIRDRYREMYDRYGVQLSGIVEEVHSSDDLAFVRGVTKGELSPCKGGDIIQVRDRFVAILKRENGRWQVTRLMWTPIEKSSD